jgi:hypothetical protein
MLAASFRSPVTAACSQVAATHDDSGPTRKDTGQVVLSHVCGLTASSTANTPCRFNDQGYLDYAGAVRRAEHW